MYLRPEKSTVVDESLSTSTTRVLLQRKPLMYLKRQQNEKYTQLPTRKPWEGCAVTIQGLEKI